MEPGAPSEQDKKINECLACHVVVDFAKVYLFYIGRLEGIDRRRITSHSRRTSASGLRPLARPLNGGVRRHRGRPSCDNRESDERHSIHTRA